MSFPLWTKSNFSFLEGASHPDELVETASTLGLSGLALTDRDGVYGVVRAHRRAKELGLHLVLGSQVSVDDGSFIVLLCERHEGYKNLCRLLSKGRLRSPKGQCQVSWDEVCEHAEGLVALWGGRGSLLVGESEPDLLARRLREAFGERLHALVVRHREADEPELEARLRERAKRFQLGTVATTEVLYHGEARRPLHDVLTCVRHHVTLATAGTLIRANAEHALRTDAAMRTLFADDLASLARAQELGFRCRFSLDELRYRYPAERLPDGTSTDVHLRALTYQGARVRWGETLPDNVVRQLDKELGLIGELDYCGYFLTMYEIVQYCRAHAILCQGRGSAANSAVCYALGITAVDPIKLNLLFERFISRERAEAPDIDLDIAHERREEVIQHVYEKYGRSHAAMVANFIRYRARSAIRDVGKVLGLPETTLDRAAKVLGYYDSANAESLRLAGLDPEHPTHRELLRLTSELQDFPRHLSIHPGGFLLGHEPVHDLVPIENGAMEGRTVVQWDKDDLEELGLFKVDLLGLGALTQLDFTFALLERHHGVTLCMATIPADDRATYEMVSRGDTVGVFQIESRAQMSMLPRLKPQCFYDLVIEVSIVRPGPITGGMVHPYLRRRAGEEPVVYPLPALAPVLEKTLGVPLFQEQVMRIAVVAADYTPGEADQLRRDMAAWRRTGRIEAHRERLLTRMQEKGVPLEFAERVFEQIRGFGSYGFPESHAASFALVSYASAYLKRHYPAAFTCGLLNAQPMGFYAPATLIEDARRHGVAILPIDVTVSDWACTLEHPTPAAAPALRMGLRYIRGLSLDQAERLLAARREASFGSLADLVRRTATSSTLPGVTLDAGSLCALAESGALERFESDRRAALWQVQGLTQTRTLPLPLESHESSPSFTQLDLLGTLGWDYRTSAHSSRGHPLLALRAELAELGLPEASAVARMRDGERARYAGMVICRQRPGTAKGVVFMTLEDETGFVNVVLWQNVFARYQLLAKTAAFLGVTGRIQSEKNVVHLVAQTLWAPEPKRRPPNPRSRDFH